MKDRCAAIDRAVDYSTNVLTNIRDALGVKGLGEDICVVATGSFGRMEASGESDVDFFLMHDSRVDRGQAEILKNDVASWIREVVPKAPAADGAFNEVESIEEMLANVGGSGDTNKKMTRRILLLLEGTYLYNSNLFDRFRRQTIERYVSSKITNHALTLFLLNDIIRYYRTMCVDFEYKTAEQRKDWAVRNLKLRYSRKLLYFGGVLAVAETPEREPDEKVSVLLDILHMTPLARLKSLFGSQAADCLSYYDTFLEKISDQNFRRSLEQVTNDRGTHTPEFRHIKNAAIRFTWALQNLLNSRYPADHPIHSALIF
jgi:hypothetical protein